MSPATAYLFQPEGATTYPPPELMACCAECCGICGCCCECWDGSTLCAEFTVDADRDVPEFELGEAGA